MSTPKKAAPRTSTPLAADERFSEKNIALIETQLIPALGQFGLALTPNEVNALVRARAEGSITSIDVVCRIVAYRLHAAFKDVQQERLDEELDDTTIF
ncbi:hypothetical protein SAMN05216567_1033 [Variovorax sp. OK605]|uniref:hypothetical protein n=1 Tax=Variovorax sp. OK605 TaxID=1855317 RepID=UPI0008E14626|nr:hypothetical protein [Variovorax sp. OK605]SFO84660.1 hypothetical protein SAMN05216567_1033 [Variovorax sp. OK605]